MLCDLLYNLSTYDNKLLVFHFTFAKQQRYRFARFSTKKPVDFSGLIGWTYGRNMKYIKV